MKRYITPYDKESEKILSRISRHGRTYTNDMNLSRNIGQKYHEYVKQDFLDISRNDRRRRSIISIPDDNLKLIPDPLPRSKFMRFRFYRIY